MSNCTTKSMREVTEQIEKARVEILKSRPFLTFQQDQRNPKKKREPEGSLFLNERNKKRVSTQRPEVIFLSVGEKGGCLYVAILLVYFFRVQKSFRILQKPIWLYRFPSGHLFRFSKIPSSYRLLLFVCSIHLLHFHHITTLDSCQTIIVNAQ